MKKYVYHILFACNWSNWLHQSEGWVLWLQVNSAHFRLRFIRNCFYIVCVARIVIWPARIQHSTSNLRKCYCFRWPSLFRSPALSAWNNGFLHLNIRRHYHGKGNSGWYKRGSSSLIDIPPVLNLYWFMILTMPTSLQRAPSLRECDQCPHSDVR